jgi:hypothetical protein
MEKKKIQSSLLSHERALIRCGRLHIQEPSDPTDASCDHNNHGDDAIWLYAVEDDDDDDDDDEENGDDDEYGELDGPPNENPLARTKCYRTMADDELLHLIEQNELPSTLPFQTLFHGPPGLDCCAGRLMEKNDNNQDNNCSSKKTKTTVVEFDCDENFVDRLFSIQCKVLENEQAKKRQERDDENAILTHSLGFRASRTLVLVNDALKRGDITWRIILVKRPMRQCEPCRPKRAA